MFANACEKVSKFTHPLVISTRTVDGTIRSSVATYFFINRDGWALTASHVFHSFEKYNHDVAHLKEVEQIRAKDAAEGRTSTVTVDPQWITNHSFWCGFDGMRVTQIHLFKDIDVAAFKLENVPPQFLENVACINDSDEVKLGQSLGIYGYPFIEVNPSFDNNNFRLPISPGFFRPYVLSGIMSRRLSEKIIETPVESFEISTPVMKGFSGCPVFDVYGNVVGVETKGISRYINIESRTVVDGVQQTSQQFNNTTLGVCSNLIKARLLAAKIHTESSSKDSEGCSYIIK